jgi:hypothetical protein
MIGIADKSVEAINIFKGTFKLAYTIKNLFWGKNN